MTHLYEGHKSAGRSLKSAEIPSDKRVAKIGVKIHLGYRILGFKLIGADEEVLVGKEWNKE